MINEVIDLINDGFDGIHKDEMVIGLTQKVWRINSSEVAEFMPGIVKMDGEIIYAGIDDIDSLMIYHKANAGTLVYGPQNSGFGDARHNQDSVAFSLIAVWDTQKIPFQSVDMLLLLRSRMPQQIKGIKDIRDVNIVPSGALLDAKQIFDSEYSFDKNYLLPNNINIIQINYTVQIRYDPQCIEKCINC